MCLSLIDIFPNIIDQNKSNIHQVEELFNLNKENNNENITKNLEENNKVCTICVYSFTLYNNYYFIIYIQYIYRLFIKRIPQKYY